MVIQYDRKSLGAQSTIILTFLFMSEILLFLRNGYYNPFNHCAGYYYCVAFEDKT